MQENRRHLHHNIAPQLYRSTLCAFSIALIASEGATFQFTKIDVPGAQCTIPNSINDAGDIAGIYQDSTGTHVFTLSAGSYKTYPQVSMTQVGGININGKTIGFGSPRRFTIASGFVTSLPRITGFSTIGGINSKDQSVGSLSYAGDPQVRYLEQSIGGNVTTFSSGYPPTQWRRIDSIALENFSDRAVTDLVVNIAQRGLNPRVAPAAILGGNAQHECGNLFANVGTSGSTSMNRVPLLPDQLTVPSQQRVGCDQRFEFTEQCSVHDFGARCRRMRSASLNRHLRLSNFAFGSRFSSFTKSITGCYWRLSRSAAATIRYRN